MEIDYPGNPAGLASTTKHLFSEKEITFGKESANSTAFLTELISIGQDSQKNLYKAYISYKDFSSDSSLQQSFEVRLESFDTPNFGASTIDLPYLNTSLPKVVPSSTISHTLKLQFRLDGSLSLYTTLVNSLSVDSIGAWKGDPNKDKVWDVEIQPLVFKSTSEYYENPSDHKWVFYDCYLTEIPSISYGYNQSGTSVVSCNFTFRQMIFE